MRTSIRDRLIRALDRREISPNLRREILNDVFFSQAPLRKTLKREASFTAIVDDVRRARRSLVGNRTKWQPELITLYEQYIGILDAIVADVIAIQSTLLPDPDNPRGPRIPASLEVVTALARRKNKKREADGYAPGPACTALWTSWVDPKTKAEMIEAFDMAYARMGRGRGRRFIPFHTTDIIKAKDHAVERHRAFIDSQRNAIMASDPDADTSTERVTKPYLALHLCALRQAEMWLDAYERDIKKKYKHPATDPVPVNWHHLLEPDLRSRLRAADENPASVTPEGLGSFLITT